MIKNLYPEKLFLAIIIWVVSFSHTSAQVVINEICPTNASIVKNSDGNYDDWFELYNAGSSQVNLAGYSITDDSTKPAQFTFPSYVLQSGQKMVVFASDHSNKVIADHWEMAVNAGSAWKYSEGKNSLDTNWRNTSFIDSTWATGFAGIGFGDGDDNTVLPVGVSVMMRKTFSIPDTSQIVKAVLLMDYDDGFVAYLNGTEIARSNIGTTGFRPAWNDLATNSHEALSYRGLPIDSFYISPSVFKSLIRPGQNVLSIEVHNTPANSDDLSAIPYLFFGMRSPGSTYIPLPVWFHAPVREFFCAKFKLNRYGEKLFLNNPQGVTIDGKAYPALAIDNSFCRIPDGSSNWCYIETPTPEESNNMSTCFTGYAYDPVFSKAGGYYSSMQSITLSTATPGGVIRYTTNGNTPTANDRIYTSPILVSKTTTVRARVFASNVLPSSLITNTYIINGNTHLSSFFITTDSVNLWDYNTGIYVLGPNAETVSPYKGANYWQDWEKPASIEYYDKNKNLVVKFDADINIFGNYSRAKPQKSFEIRLKDSYGTGSFVYPMYSDKPYVDNNSNIILRNSGTDWNRVHFRDAMMERILKSTNTGYLAAQPAILYLNGDYWGVYCIDENHDQHWMKNNFGLGKSEIDYLKESGNNIKVEEGSDTSFWSLYNYATTQNPSSQQYFDKINNTLDLKNYTDYFVAETFYNNGDWIGDWTNNIKIWRPNSAGSKWRYLLYDLDFGLGLHGTVDDNRLSIARNPAAFSYSSEMFDAILNNPTYKRYFINRYADLMNTIFLSSNMNAVMHSLKDTMAFDMTAHFAKWGSSTTNWNANITDMMSFASARPDIMKNYIKKEFSLAGVVTLTFQTSPAGSGRIEISTITPTTYPWTGDYFNGNPVTITAIPNPGYAFDHWRSDQAIKQNNPNQSVTYNFAKNEKITAFFKGATVPTKICISELNYNSSSTYNSGDWIELHNYGTTSLDISGWKLSDGTDKHFYVFPTGTKIDANGYLVVVEDSIKFKSQFPTVTNWIGLTGFNFSNAGDQVRLFNYAGVQYLTFFYQDLAPWPLQADGLGYTCELKTNTSDPNNGASWFAGCIGGSPGKAYNSTLSVPVSVTGSTTFCSGSSTSLLASTMQGNTYQWKKNNVNISGAVDSMYNVTQAGSYSVSITNNGCSAVTNATNITTVTQQPVPVATSASRCGAGDIDLSASSSDSVFWYDASTGGNQIGAGNALHLPYVSQTSTYYARTGKNCQSNSAAAIATIIPKAASPLSNDTMRCGPGAVTLNAVDTAEIRWYNSATGGGLLATGTTFTTNILENDTSFFIEAGNTCPSSRIEVSVMISATPEPVVSDISRCGEGTLTLSAISSFPVLWYKEQSGGISISSGLNFTTPYITHPDTFYAEANNGCPSARVRSIAIINSIPPDPVSADILICGAGSATLTADATEQVKWYDSQSGGNLLYTGSVFNTPVISTTKTYFVATGYDCMSNRIPVRAIVGIVPTPPVTKDVSRCDSGSIRLSASAPDSVYWYDSPLDGNLIFTGNDLYLPVITSTQTFYISTGTECKSDRIAVNAFVNSTPPVPVVNDVSRCDNGSVTLTAQSNATVLWYDVPVNGNLIATGNDFATPILTATTTYYVEAGTFCRSNRVPVQAIINPMPLPPVVTDGSRCGEGIVTLSASSPLAINWYDNTSGGTPIATGPTFTTPFLTSGATYYVNVNSDCKGSPVEVFANIYSYPVVNLGPDTILIPGGQSITLDAGQGFASYLWSTGETTSQIHISTPGNYSVVVSNEHDCSASDAIVINFITTISTIDDQKLIRLYPNPAKDKITVEVSNLPDKTVSIKLYSIDGKVIQKREENSVNGQLSKTISLAGISSGIYFLEVECDLHLSRMKIIVE